jgi:hypothetical protein
VKRFRKERFPDSGEMIDQFKEQLEQGALLLVAADSRADRPSGGVGSQITIGRYPNPISAGAQEFSELVAGTLTGQVEELGAADVSVVERPPTRTPPAALRRSPKWRSLIDSPCPRLRPRALPGARMRRASHP